MSWNHCLILITSSLFFSLNYYPFLLLSTSLLLSLDKVELAHDMKDSDESNETDAHDKDNIGWDLETGCVVRVELKHGSGCTTRGSSSTGAAARLPPTHACSCSCTSSLWSSTTHHSFFVSGFKLLPEIWCRKLRNLELYEKISTANIYISIWNHFPVRNSKAKEWSYQDK